MQTIQEADVKFMHNKEAGYTVGYIAQEKGDRIRVKAAASWCNYKDQFNRKIGRAVVTGRLNCDRDNGKLHNVEFFLSGKLPTSGDMWRQFERAILNETMSAYQDHDGVQ